jgi:hypothetical protein
VREPVGGNGGHGGGILRRAGRRSIQAQNGSMVNGRCPAPHPAPRTSRILDPKIRVTGEHCRKNCTGHRSRGS